MTVCLYMPLISYLKGQGRGGFSTIDFCGLLASNI